MVLVMLDPAAYGDACSELLQNAAPCQLGPGKPNREIRHKLAALDDASLFDAKPIIDPEMADCCRAGLWLLFDFLDESHSISQGVSTATGSYWHGIMHRREPDFSNSKYWFRQVGNHPIFDPLCESARQIAQDGWLDARAEWLVGQTSWDSCRYVDLCEAVLSGRSSSREVCGQVALAEWKLLFDHCYHGAIGG